MHEDITTAILKAHDRAVRAQNIDVTLKQMRSGMQHLSHKVLEYKRELAKESLDVYKLETHSIGSFFHSVMGTREARLQKERGDAVKARQKCSQAEKELRELETCISDLEAEKELLMDANAEYERLYEQKRQMLLKENGSDSERILELTLDISSLKDGLRQIHEAVAAGENAMRYLSSAHRNLTKAKSYGTYDMAGGKLRSHIGKYTHVDSAAIDVGIAQTAIDKFREQLAGLNISLNDSGMSVALSPALRATELFYDRLVTDWYAQTRIEGSLGSVTVTREDVQNTLNMLKTLEFQDRRRLTELQSKLDSIVLGKSRRQLADNIKGYLK